MQLTRDFYGHIKQTALLLANPQKSKIGLLSGVEDLDIKLYFNSISELSFKIYKKSNGKLNKYYSRLIIGKLIEAKYMGWFQIKKVDEKQDADSKVKYKEITCLSLENELIYKRVDNIDGVYALYDVSDKEHSLLHIIADQCKWHIGSISNNLIGKYRTISVDSEKIYNLLTTDIAKSFNCIFKFDTYTKTINAYPLEEIGKLTNITISDKNILQTYVKASDLDKIVTKMRVRGGSNDDGTPFDIRAVNPTGMDYIINVDYFMTTEWMSQVLINALNAYKARYNNYQTQYSAALSAFKLIQSDLTGLEAQLDTLESQRDAYISEYKSYVAIHDRVPRYTDLEYHLYNTAYNAANAKQVDIDAKNMEISNKESQLNTVKTLLDSIGSDLNMNNNFTATELEELDNFLIAGEDYVDDTFIANDSMTEAEIIELKLELLHNAENELSRASRPQYTFTTTISNLYTITDDIDSKISYSTWKEKFIPGNMITLKFRDDYTIQVRLMSLDFNFNSIDAIEATFSDKRRLDDELIQLSEILAQADRTSSSFSLAKFGYDAASKQTSAVRDFMNGTLNATLNRVISDDHIQTEISQYGILNRKWLDDQNTYSPYQSWLTQNVLLFTDDNWQSSKTGIGLFTNSNRETFYGVLAPVICGDLVMSTKLNITNNSGTYTLTDNGFNASNKNYSVTINPNTPSEIFKIAVNGVNRLYVDTITNKLVFSGDLSAATGNFSGQITGGSISINNRFLVDSLGNCRANSLDLTGGSINFNDRFKVSSSGMVTINSNGLAINSTNFQLDADGTIHCTNGDFTGNIKGGTININNSFTVDNLGNFYATTAKFGGKYNSVTIDNSGIYVKDWDTGETKSRIWINSMETEYVFCKYLVVTDIENIYISSNKSVYNYLARKYHDHNELVDEGKAVRWGSNKLFPWSTADLGDNTHRWGTLYVSSGGINTSDKNLKHDIEPLSDVYKNLILKLKPVRFKYNDGTSDRYHTGFVSQDVEELMLDLGMNSHDLAAFVKSPVYSVMSDDGVYDTTSDITGYIYMLRYDELISPTIFLIQEQQNKIDNLVNLVRSQQEVIEKLTDRITTLENKLI